MRRVIAELRRVNDELRTVDIPAHVAEIDQLRHWKDRAEKAEAANKKYEARAWQDGRDIDRLMRERDALRAEVERLTALVRVALNPSKDGRS